MNITFSTRNLIKLHAEADRLEQESDKAMQRGSLLVARDLRNKAQTIRQAISK